MGTRAPHKWSVGAQLAATRTTGVLLMRNWKSEQESLNNNHSGAPFKTHAVCFLVIKKQIKTSSFLFEQFLMSKIPKDVIQRKFGR